MLRYLQVQNFAIVSELELEFGGRLTVFTGETGAGKSILIQALGLVLGDRADSTMIRTGMDKASVTAVFNTEDAREVLEALEAQGNGQEIGNSECIIKRQLSSDGRSRAFVNGTAVTVQQLRQLGELLVDMHGQHEHQSLLRRDVQRDLLDEFAGHAALVVAVADNAARWQQCSAKLQSLTGGIGNIDEECERLRYDIAELERVQPDALDITDLELEHKRRSNLFDLQTGGETLLNNLADGEINASSLLADAGRALQTLSDVDDSLSGLVKLLEGASIGVNEAVNELRRYLDGLESEPGALTDLESRLTVVHDTARKFRCPIAELPTRLANLLAQMADLQNRADRLSGLEAELADTERDYQESSDALSASRSDHAKTLAADVTCVMRELGIPSGTFEIKLSSAGNRAPVAHGNDIIEFQVSANPGQPPRPIAKVASGGELSRISLSIQVCAARDKGIPTMVFDEVDAGIGGGVAEIVGQQLRSLAEKRQILCVTHLPQVACLGHQHLQVSKHAGGNNTATTIVTLDKAERTEEIARMLGGLTITAQTRAHAREMLAQ